MRTLSARILLGFAALTIAFGVIIATVVFNMSQVEAQVQLIAKGFMPLALATKDLESRQDDLYSFLEGGYQEEATGTGMRQRLALHRNRRSRELEDARKIVSSLLALNLPSERLRGVRQRIEDFARDVEGLEPRYKILVADPPAGPPDAWTDKQRAAAATLAQLRDEERKLQTRARNLSMQLENYVRGTGNHLERSQHTVRIWTIYLGGGAVLLGLFITAWVVITLRPLRRLRDGARRIAAGDYASRIDEGGPSEVRDLAREFNSMGRAVEERERELVRSERLAAVGKMAAMITHEVRNPLSSIGLNTELLEEELANVPKADEARGLCRSIHREVDRLTAITEEYLAFARLPKPKVAPEPVNPIVSALADFVREDLAAKQVALATDLAAEHLIATIDAGQIRQCLINLLRNAADAVAAKGSGHVTLRTRRDGDAAAIVVEDDGIGIPAEVLPRLFDPFFSTKEGGNGLGLALTQQIVRDHGGTLDVTSSVGQGTCFTLRVPLHRAQVSKLAT